MRFIIFSEPIKCCREWQQPALQLAAKLTVSDVAAACYAKTPARYNCYRTCSPLKCRLKRLSHMLNFSKYACINNIFCNFAPLGFAGCLSAVATKREPGESPGQSRCGNFHKGTITHATEYESSAREGNGYAGISPKTCPANHIQCLSFEDEKTSHLCRSAGIAFYFADRSRRFDCGLFPATGQRHHRSHPFHCNRSWIRKQIRYICRPVVSPLLVTPGEIRIHRHGAGSETSSGYHSEGLRRRRRTQDCVRARTRSCPHRCGV